MPYLTFGEHRPGMFSSRYPFPEFLPSGEGVYSVTAVTGNKVFRIGET